MISIQSLFCFSVEKQEKGPDGYIHRLVSYNRFEHDESYGWLCAKKDGMHLYFEEVKNEAGNWVSVGSHSAPWSYPIYFETPKEWPPFSKMHWRDIKRYHRWWKLSFEEMGW